MARNEGFPQDAVTPPAGVGRRLESWKDIAAYLKRDVSTVKRWEKREGLPVHRHMHDKRGSPYVDTSEVDDWKRGRGSQFEREQRNVTSFARRRSPVVVGGGLAALAILGAVVLFPTLF